MSVQALPSVETLAVLALLGDADVSAIVGTKVYTETPETLTYPLVRVIRIGGSASDHHWLDRPTLQVEAFTKAALPTYGFNGIRSAARGLCELAVVALHNLEATSAVVGAVRDIIGPRSIPSGVNQVSRFTAEVEITLHPLVSESS